MEMSYFFCLTVCFVNLSLLSYVADSKSYTFLNARRLQDYDDKKLQQSEIHTFTNLTKIECCSACGREKFCFSFLFYSGAPTCVTLRERFEYLTVTSTADTGYQLFQTDKPLATVGSDCELDVDCMSLPHAHCHEGSCRCDVGHRLDGNTCRNHIELCASTPGYTWDVGTDMCYRIVTTAPKNWADAERSCSINQGHLIKLDTASKHDKLRALLTETSLYGLWVGARVMSDAETWRWHDNTAVMLMQWGTGEPSGDGKCMSLLKTLAYKWNDVRCRRKQNYICEIQMN